MEGVDISNVRNWASEASSNVWVPRVYGRLYWYLQRWNSWSGYAIWLALRDCDSFRLDDRKEGMILGESVCSGSRLASSRTWLTSRIGEWACVCAECRVDRCCGSCWGRLCRKVERREDQGLGVVAWMCIWGGGIWDVILGGLSVMSCGIWEQWMWWHCFFRCWVLEVHNGWWGGWSDVFGDPWLGQSVSAMRIWWRRRLHVQCPA